jgi:CRP/FNR family transcriptional regulator, nitrogen fixation regulation protein
MLEESAATWVSAPMQQSQLSSTRPALHEIAGGLARSIRCRRGQEIYRQNSAAVHWYRLTSGTARRFAVRVDGRRQIVDLLVPGDIFGFGVRSRHRFTVEAVTEGTVVACYPRARLDALAGSDPHVARELHEAMCEAMSRLQSQIMILGRTTAQQKVGAFLLNLAERLAESPVDVVVLPISRYDIADFLALSVETVSRSLTRLKRRGAITLDGPRRIRIVDRGAFGDGDCDDDWDQDEDTGASRVAQSRVAQWRHG